MKRLFFQQVEGVKGLACKVLYIRVTSNEECSQTTRAFFFKPLENFYILKLVFKVGLPNKSEMRKIEFGLKKERKVIFRTN